MYRSSKFFIKLGLVFIAILPSLSCSVISDRKECMGRLIIDLQECEVPQGDTLRIVVTDGGGVKHRFEVPSSGAFPESLEMLVAQGQCEILSWWGDDGLGISSEGSFVIPGGRDCPPLHIGHSSLRVRDGLTRHSLKVNKRYAKVCVMLSYDSSESPYEISVEGSVNGYSADLSPSQGSFNVLIDNFSGFVRSFNLPQQTSGDLKLRLREKTSMLSRSFALGEMILSLGYDWQQEDLADVTVILDYAQLTIVVSAEGWKGSQSVEIVL